MRRAMQEAKAFVGALAAIGGAESNSPRIEPRWSQSPLCFIGILFRNELCRRGRAPACIRCVGETAWTRRSSGSCESISRQPEEGHRRTFAITKTRIGESNDSVLKCRLEQYDPPVLASLRGAASNARRAQPPRTRDAASPGARRCQAGAGISAPALTGIGLSRRFCTMGIVPPELFHGTSTGIGFRRGVERSEWRSARR